MFQSPKVSLKNVRKEECSTVLSTPWGNSLGGKARRKEGLEYSAYREVSGEGVRLFFRGVVPLKGRGGDHPSEGGGYPPNQHIRNIPQCSNQLADVHYSGRWLLTDRKGGRRRSAVGERAVKLINNLQGGKKRSFVGLVSEKRRKMRKKGPTAIQRPGKNKLDKRSSLSKFKEEEGSRGRLCL